MTARPAAMATEAPKPKEIPDIIVDPNSKRRYERGRFLGKVGSKISFTSFIWISFRLIF